MTVRKEDAQFSEIMEDINVMDILLLIGLVALFALIFGMIAWCDKQIKGN